MQVGASNELPESEELDALYDRFLIRRSVSQVSSSQLGNLARLAAGTKLVAQAPSNGAGTNGAGAPADPEAGPGLDLEDFRSEVFQHIPLSPFPVPRFCLDSIVLVLWSCFGVVADALRVWSLLVDCAM